VWVFYCDQGDWGLLEPVASVGFRFFIGLLDFVRGVVICAGWIE